MSTTSSDREEGSRAEPSDPVGLAHSGGYVDWMSIMGGECAANTLRAWKADWRVFEEFCAPRRLTALPASPQSVRAFLQECVAGTRSRATLQRYVTTIRRVHRRSGCADPTVAHEITSLLSVVNHAERPATPSIRGLSGAEIDQYLNLPPRTLRDHRDRALIALAYDAMCGCRALVGVAVNDIEPAPGGSGTVSFRRLDRRGAFPALADLSPRTMELIHQWARLAGRQHGRLFVAIVGETVPLDSLAAENLADVFRRAGRRIGLPPEAYACLSGHSARVGAMQDLVALGIDLKGAPARQRVSRTRCSSRPGLRSDAGVRRSPRAPDESASR